MKSTRATNSVCSPPQSKPPACRGLIGEGSRPSVRVEAIRPRRAPTLRQPRLGQALGDAREIARVFVGKNALAVLEREIRIDLEQLRPCGARLLRAAEMAVAGG